MNAKSIAERVKRGSISSARNLLLRVGLYGQVRTLLARFYAAPTVSVQGLATDFTQDYFSAHIPLFERFLGGLRDRPCHLLEIGTWEGRSALWMAQNIATHRSSSVETVDLYENPKLRRNLTAVEGKVTFRPGPSAEVLRTLALDTYDFVYVDGCHWTINVLEDAVLAFRLLKRGGIMAFDDYLWDDPEWNQEGRPKEAVDAFLAIYASNLEVLHRDDQVWVRKLRKLAS
jgi:SAM-dependent methyltransferase